MTPPGYKIVRTVDELIHFVAFGDTCEAAFFFRDDKKKDDEFAVEIPLNRPDDDDLRNIAPEEEWHMRMLAILVAFRDGRLCKGGYVAQKKKIRRKGKAR